jgi:hypothetical protein
LLIFLLHVLQNVPQNYRTIQLKITANSSNQAIRRLPYYVICAPLAPQQHPNLPIPPRMRQHPRPADQRRVVPHMLVVPTSQFGNPMVFFVLEVANYGLLVGLLHGCTGECCRRICLSFSVFALKSQPLLA